MQIKAMSALLASCVLSACGGSDSNDTETPSQPQPTSNISPTAIFSQPDDIYERGEFVVDASGSNDSDGSISSYSWSIDLGDYTGNNISLSDNGANSTLVVGEIEEDVTVSVNLTVTDNDGATDDYSNAITIHERDVEKLPPMPANSATGLEGTDSDGDGVRDDIEIKVYNLYPLSKDNREVTRKAAQVFQNVLITGNSADDLDDGDASEQLAKLVWCYNLHTDLNSKQERAKIKALVFDTPERLEALEKFKQSRNGTIQKTVESTFSECRLPQN
tara:strand:+ start:7317 stop:8141 length:825 start_codon:yes stop_codon:yes gene_type:complete